jgi:hypothetical protein
MDVQCGVVLMKNVRSIPILNRLNDSTTQPVNLALSYD